jgi:hypothetical protein
LKNSARNAMLCFSRILAVFWVEKSNWFTPGPRPRLRAAFPQAPRAGTANAAMLRRRRWPRREERYRVNNRYASPRIFLRDEHRHTPGPGVR